MTDVELLKFAAANDDMEACEFVEDHNRYYACVNRHWEGEDCFWEIFIGEEEACWYEKAIASGEYVECLKVNNLKKRAECEKELNKPTVEFDPIREEIDLINNLTLDRICDETTFKDHLVLCKIRKASLTNKPGICSEAVESKEESPRQFKFYLSEWTYDSGVTVEDLCVIF